MLLNVCYDKLVYSVYPFNMLQKMFLYEGEHYLTMTFLWKNLELSTMIHIINPTEKKIVVC